MAPKSVLAAAVLLLTCISSAWAAEGTSWSSLNSQAVSLYKQGRYDEAAAAGEEAVKAAETSFGPDHPNVAACLNNAGAAYMAAGNYAKAEFHFRRAVSIDERVYGRNHPATVADRANLTELQKSMGSLETAAQEEKPLSETGMSDGDMEALAASMGAQEEGAVRWDAPYEKWEKAGFAEKKICFWDNVDAEFMLESGYRADDLNWSIAGNLGGLNPNILSELTWTDLQSFQVKGTGRFTAEKLYYIRGSFAYSWIFNGDNQDSDYDANDRRAEFSRSNNKSDDGTLLDANLGLGYPFGPYAEEYQIRVMPLAGYSYHEQNLTITDGFQTIPATGPFDGLDSEYQTQWHGPWVGLDLSIKLFPKLKFLGTFEYHWANYLARARWNLRTDFQQPESFRHTADGNGIVGGMRFFYLLSDKWTLYFGGDVQDWSTDPGTDTVFFSDNTTLSTRLNQVNWESWAVSLGGSYTF
ncbi:MAG: tetratricopeptide repeat protein [Candidatus Omnitrophica bacterium]|nr:tetratricopeptide repeat protein [Candidatus Omnitrophota bacterium]